MAAVAPHPRLVFWETTTRCNLACHHCRRTELDAAAVRDLDHPAACRLIDDIAATGPAILVFSGGEPLCRPDWPALVAHARSAGLRVALATNGTLVDDPLAERLAGLGVERVSVSLDGAEAATHDALRAQPGSFAAALRGLRALARAGVASQINVTVTRANQAQLPALYDLARGHGAVALHLFVLVPVGCGADLDDRLRLAPGQQERVLRWLAERAEAGPLEVRATCAPFYHRILRQRGHDLRSAGCLAGTGVCFVAHDGRVQPCGYLPQSAGDVRATPFAEIWRSSPLFERLRAGPLSGRCGACDHAGHCGGCRARAAVAGGDLLGPDPDCAYVPPGR